MYHYSQPTQIFTVFGSYVLDGDYVRTNNARSGSEARYVTRNAEAANASREAARL